MKKCPICGSIGPEEITCGVCGADLWSVPPITQTIERSEGVSGIDVERRLVSQIRKKAALRLGVGVPVTLAILISGFVLIFLGSIWGVALILVSLMVARSLLGSFPYERDRVLRERAKESRESKKQ